MSCENRYSAETLASLRDIPSEEVLRLLGIHGKVDPTYLPVKDNRSRRWHVCTNCGEFEILTTGPKWYDTRAKKGGGGAIDLAMHLLQLSFRDAVKLLGQDKPEPHATVSRPQSRATRL